MDYGDFLKACGPTNNFIACVAKLDCPLDFIKWSEFDDLCDMWGINKFLF